MNLTAKEAYYKNYSYLRHYAAAFPTFDDQPIKNLYEAYKKHMFWFGDEFCERESEGACAALEAILNRTAKLDFVDYSIGNYWSDKKLLSTLRKISYQSYRFNLND